MSSYIHPGLPVFTIYFRELLLSTRTKLRLREPLTEAINTYVSRFDVYPNLTAVGTSYLIIVSPLHISRSYRGLPHYTVEAYNSANDLVSVLHVGEYGGGGEVFLPDANTLEKRRQRPLKREL